MCHIVKHIGRANAMGNQTIAFEHLERVNEWSHKQVVTHVAMEFERFKERSKHEWTIDLTILTKHYKTDEKLITEAHNKPRITDHPWKKKRKKKR
jgi:hypothetical protein